MWDCTGGGENYFPEVFSLVLLLLFFFDFLFFLEDIIFITLYKYKTNTTTTTNTNTITITTTTTTTPQTTTPHTTILPIFQRGLHVQGAQFIPEPLKRPQSVDNLANLRPLLGSFLSSHLFLSLSLSPSPSPPNPSPNNFPPSSSPPFCFFFFFFFFCFFFSHPIAIIIKQLGNYCVSVLSLSTQEILPWKQELLSPPVTMCGNARLFGLVCIYNTHIFISYDIFY